VLYPLSYEGVRGVLDVLMPSRAIG
jgi:hypothetical protein